MVVRCARQTRSRLAPVRCPPNNSASGLGVNRCHGCFVSNRDVKETIHNGLLLIRIRYGLPYCELPDCSPSELGRFLSFLLLQGKERATVEFPRRQRRGKDGLCTLQRLCRRERWELAHSVSSIKRNLPAGCSRHTPSPRIAWEQNAVSQPFPPSPEYLQHVKAVVSRLFPASWDKSYESFVGSHVPNATSRKRELSRADLLWKGRREEFLTACLQESSIAPLFCARYKEVQSAGKKRPLLIYDEQVELLAPLHKMVFNHLSKSTDWLLVGPPTEGRVASVCVGEYQTSIDLVSATDGLSHCVSEAILESMFFTSVKVPRSIRSLAYASLSPVFQDRAGIHRRVRHGQMMGAYLSFPLLCIHSYVAATWASRDCGLQTRILVNGDDTIISTSRPIVVQDYPQGYRLNDDKTIRAKNVAEINSTAFLREGTRWREVRHLRRGGATVDFKGMLHMAVACRARPSWQDAYSRARIGRRWGFLPSQIGHTTYPAYRREQGMLRRFPTVLPEAPTSFVTCLVAHKGRWASTVESEIMTSWFWKHGREGGLKRDVWDPSCGSIRRTYGYLAQPNKARVGFVCWRGQRSSSLRKEQFFLPPGEMNDEEKEGLSLLDLMRQAFDSLVAQ